VTGITISSRQVQIATRLARSAAGSADASTTPTTAAAAAAAANGPTTINDADGADAGGYIPHGDKGGRVRFLELDAEKMGEYFTSGSSSDAAAADADADAALFDVVWISEALSHFPDKALFFRNAHRLLRAGGAGRLVLADWFKAEGLGEREFEADIKPIEGEIVGMRENASGLLI
jgi:SAM-dependent methyltransferase